MSTGSLAELGKGLMLVGLVLVVVGICCLALPRVPWLGRLPGDIVVRRESWTVYAPLGTCLVISVVLSLIMWFLSRR